MNMMYPVYLWCVVGAFICRFFVFSFSFSFKLECAPSPLVLNGIGACFSLWASPWGLNDMWPNDAVKRCGQVIDPV